MEEEQLQEIIQNTIYSIMLPNFERKERIPQNRKEFLERYLEKWKIAFPKISSNQSGQPSDLVERIANKFASVVNFYEEERVMPGWFEIDRGDFVPWMPEERVFRAKIEEDKLALFILNKMIFVNENGMMRVNPYSEQPAHIGESQTCSAPHMVFLYNVLAGLARKHNQIFEAGAGSGYQAAVYANTHKEAQVFAIDPHRNLVERARENLTNVSIKTDFGLASRISIEQGNWFNVARDSYFARNTPYDVISFAFMFPKEHDLIGVAESSALNEGGVLIAPVGHETEGSLRVYHKRANGVESADILNVNFVPAILPTSKL